MPNALKMLKHDHDKVKKEFDTAIATDDAKKKWKHFDSIASDLEIHAALEEEIFYPAVEAATGMNTLVRDSLEDHRQVKRMVSDLRLIDPSEIEFHQLLVSLRDSVVSHVAEEENVMFPAAEKALGSKLDDIGSTMARRKTQLKLAGPVAKQVDVDVPTHTAYEQWTDFENFPKFMQGVEEVYRKDGQIHWRAKVGGKVEEWDARIDEEDPDSRIAWHSISGPPQSGRVTFRPLTPSKTRVLVEMIFKPQGAAETIGAAMGLHSKRIESDLKRFKEVTESRYGNRA